MTRLPHPDAVNELMRLSDISSVTCKQQRQIAFDCYIQLYVMSRAYERFVAYPIIDWKNLLLQRKKHLYQALGNGAFVADIEYFFEQYPEKACAFFSKISGITYSRISTFIQATWNKGVVVFIPENIIFTEPLCLNTILDNQPICIEQIFIIIEPYAQATILDSVKTDHAPEQSIFRSVVALVDNHAHLSWMYAHTLSKNVSEQSSYTFLLHKESIVHCAISITSGNIVNVWIDLLLQAEGAQAHCAGYYFLDGNKQYALICQQKHGAAHTNSTVMINGVLQDRAHSLYVGTIEINSDADYTNARQSNKNLILGESAQAVSIPSLEVSANKVQCHHGSAIGQLSSDHIAYLQARGIGADGAQKMLTKGFLEESLEGLPPILYAQMKKHLTKSLISFFK